jgi:hypothetical protein
MSAYDPDTWTQGQMADMDISWDEYGEYIDPYDWMPEQFHQMKYSEGITGLQNEFAQQSKTLDQNIGALGFENSFMEQDIKDSLNIDFFDKSNKLTTELGQDIMKERTSYEERFWSTISDLASADIYSEAMEDATAEEDPNNDGKFWTWG